MKPVVLLAAVSYLISAAAAVPLQQQQRHLLSPAAWISKQKRELPNFAKLGNLNLEARDYIDFGAPPIHREARDYIDFGAPPIHREARDYIDFGALPIHLKARDYDDFGRPSRSEADQAFDDFETFENVNLEARDYGGFGAPPALHKTALNHQQVLKAVKRSFDDFTTGILIGKRALSVPEKKAEKRAKGSQKARRYLIGEGGLLGNPYGKY